MSQSFSYCVLGAFSSSGANAIPMNFYYYCLDNRVLAESEFAQISAGSTLSEIDATAVAIEYLIETESWDGGSNRHSVVNTSGQNGFTQNMEEGDL